MMRAGVAAVLALSVGSTASAQEKKPPYWASIASGEAMMRVGPGKNYPGVWLYKRRDLPVRVLKVQPNWRLIEDPDGAKGWMLVTLLSDRRTAIVRPGALRELRGAPNTASHVAYRAQSGVVGRIAKCREGWCRMTVADREGYVQVSDIWGVSDGESVD